MKPALELVLLIFSIVTQLVTAGIFIGALCASIKYIEKQINRLEMKQDKNNCLIERMVVVEESTKAAHHRINEITEGKGKQNV